MVNMMKASPSCYSTILSGHSIQPSILYLQQYLYVRIVKMVSDQYSNTLAHFIVKYVNYIHLVILSTLSIHFIVKYLKVHNMLKLITLSTAVIIRV